MKNVDTNPMRTILTALLMTLATYVVGETTFEFDNEKYRINLFDLYCPPAKDSGYANIIKEEIDYAKREGLAFEKVYQIWCDGPTITKENNQVVSIVRVKPALASLPDQPDEQLQKMFNTVLLKNKEKIFDDPNIKKQFKDFNDFKKSQTGISAKDFQAVLVQTDPIPILLTLGNHDLGNELITNMTFVSIVVENNKAFNIALSDNRGYTKNIDHLKLLTKIALSLEKVEKEKPEQNLSNLSDKEQAGIKRIIQNAIRPYWRLAPNSPASNVVIAVRLEFDESGTVKEESINLIRSEGGSQKAVRTAFRAAKTAIKRASLAGGFKFPADKFEQWKALELEFDQKK